MEPTSPKGKMCTPAFPSNDFSLSEMPLAPWMASFTCFGAVVHSVVVVDLVDRVCVCGRSRVVVARCFDDVVVASEIEKDMLSCFDSSFGPTRLEVFPDMVEREIRLIRACTFGLFRKDIFV